MDEDWPSYAGNAGHSRYIKDGYEFDGDALEVAWSVDYSGSVAISDETVYLGTVALDATDGSVVWENTDVDAWNPSVVGDTVYLRGEQVVALDRSDGSVRWESDFDTDGSITDHTVAYDAVFVVVDGTLYALEATDGSVRWSIESVTVESPDHKDADEYEFVTSAAAANGVIYAGTPGAALAVEPESGDEVWRNALDFMPTGMRAQATSTGAVLGRYSSAEAGIMDAQTGNALTLGVSAGVDIALGESVFVSGDDYMFSGLSLDKPFDQLWEKSLLHTGARPVISGETVYVYFPDDTRPDGTEPYANYSDALVALNKRDGTEKWSLSADDTSVGTIQAISGETIYVNRDRKLIALRAPADRSDDSDGDGDEGDRDDGDGNAGNGSEGGGSSDGGSSSGETSGGGGDDGGSGNTGDGSDTGNEPSGSETDTDGGSNGQDGSDSGSSDTEDASSADNVPGFTTGAGIVGGALGLEWLRRRTGAEDAEEYR
ncbi:PQQ-binding-like beta-propeller repeat protein [Natrinema gelatinilyticum]|uniref:PQQ-binding-like beta-propeller repeat protein n=1 Tax=Natrinema gelatinilyticum TaxID=2961571 RepID=UPI0020C5631D|nr:PQQ-binding-like beta-propeller repeat protein [Natrinema gelatinilyticum]